jgi:hypothetical protein
MIEFLRSVKLTLGILTAIALMSVWGTLAPHRNIYHHPFYLGALCLLGLNVLLCLAPRLKILKGRFSLKKGGFLLSHSGILVILFGALISLVFSIRTLVWLGPGDTVDKIPTRGMTFEPLGFALTLQRFSMQIHPTGIPDHYVSHVLVHGPDTQERSVAIAVNHPFKKNSYRVFQSSYRLRSSQLVQFAYLSPNDEIQHIEVMVPGEPVTIETKECPLLMVKGLRYEPHFFMAGPNEIGSHSLQPHNPAVQVLLQCGEGEPETGWLFLSGRRFRDFDGGLERHLRIVMVDHTYETGLEFVQDPGVKWVLVGAFFLLTGLFLYLISGFCKGERNT